MFKAAVILRILSSLKFKECSFDGVKSNWFVSAESLLKIFAFVWTSVTNLLSIERGGVIGIFIVIKSFKN